MSPTDKIATSLDCIITSPDKILYEGKVARIDVPGLKQQLSILPDHTPLYAQLGSGRVQIHSSSGQAEDLPIQGGVIRVRSNQVTLITGFNTTKDNPT